jgi:hypothetical protein
MQDFEEIKSELKIVLSKCASKDGKVLNYLLIKGF